MLWEKNGKFFDGRLELDGKVMFIAGEPDPELMRRAGYEEYVPPTPIPPPKRYSKLKVIRALGERWGEYKAGLEANGLLDEFLAAQFLAEDDPAFAPIYASLSEEEKQILDTECLYD